jgi:hypothetical protein
MSQSLLHQVNVSYPLQDYCPCPFDCKSQSLLSQVNVSYLALLRLYGEFRSSCNPFFIRSMNPTLPPSSIESMRVPGPKNEDLRGVPPPRAGPIFLKPPII